MSKVTDNTQQTGTVQTTRTGMSNCGQVNQSDNPTFNTNRGNIVRKPVDSRNAQVANQESASRLTFEEFEQTLELYTKNAKELLKSKDLCDFNKNDIIAYIDLLFDLAETKITNITYGAGPKADIAKALTDITKDAIDKGDIDITCHILDKIAHCKSISNKERIKILNEIASTKMCKGIQDVKAKCEKAITNIITDATGKLNDAISNYKNLSNLTELASALDTLSKIYSQCTDKDQKTIIETELTKTIETIAENENIPSEDRITILNKIADTEIDQNIPGIKTKCQKAITKIVTEAIKDLNTKIENCKKSDSYLDLEEVTNVIDTLSETYSNYTDENQKQLIKNELTKTITNIANFQLISPEQRFERLNKIASMGMCENMPEVEIECLTAMATIMANELIKNCSDEDSLITKVTSYIDKLNSTYSNLSENQKQLIKNSLQSIIKTIIVTKSIPAQKRLEMLGKITDTWAYNDMSGIDKDQCSRAIKNLDKIVKHRHEDAKNILLGILTLPLGIIAGAILITLGAINLYRRRKAHAALKTLATEINSQDAIPFEESESNPKNKVNN